MISQWRTVLIIGFLSLVLLVALWMCSRAPEAFGVDAFATFAWAVVLMATAAAGKSTFQHLGGGSGVRGAVAALVTETKPGEAPRP